MAEVNSRSPAAELWSIETPAAAFFRRRRVLNFCRLLAGSSFRSRVKFCQEPARGIFHAFGLSPVGLPLGGHVLLSAG
jgi:hypothetical protein